MPISTDRSHFEIFKHLAVFTVSEALRRALTEHSGPSRAAIVVAVGNVSADLYVYDEHGLLDGYADALKDHFHQSTAWREGKVPQLQIPGLVSAGALMPPQRLSGDTFIFVMIFSEDHGLYPNPGPTRIWLQYASLRLIQELSKLSVGERSESEMLKQSIESHSRLAVIGYIHHKRTSLSISQPEAVSIHDVIDCIMGVSLSLEEGRPPKGTIGFISSTSIASAQLTAAFSSDEAIAIKNYKHVRKILQTVEGTKQVLIADDQLILGICSSKIFPRSTIKAEFYGRRGEVMVDDEIIVSFANGRFDFRRLIPDWRPLRHSVQQWSANSANVHPKIADIIAKIATNAILLQHGCTVVIDPNSPATLISGQRLSASLDLSKKINRELAAAMTHVDGAIHINPQAQLLAFGCLLDGKIASHEERSRGARYNSALRFAEAHPECIIIVVSVDGHVTIFTDGKETVYPTYLPPQRINDSPPTLDTWLRDRATKGR